MSDQRGQWIGLLEAPGTHMRVQYKKVCTKQEAEEIQRLWNESNVGLNPAPLDGFYMWFRSVPKITTKWNGAFSVKFIFTPADPPLREIRPLPRWGATVPSASCSAYSLLL